MKLTKSVTVYGKATLTWFEEIFEEYYSSYGKATLTWFEEIFEEYKMMGKAGQLVFFDVYRLVR
ncbi:N-ethylammeline chlorohydrolase [Streptococcus pneumoniae]|uniref:hypothetical protein n=1 Tax=Streptococcus pneumoniae TaxID=1313 RepID=UPI0005DF7D4F|nr:hypothetical protein [Streptococcus pneumoniae]CGG11455.1 N-ethylammeline chlorohydrolase [Streptococcus pneumoniae]